MHRSRVLDCDQLQAHPHVTVAQRSSDAAGGQSRGDFNRRDTGQKQRMASGGCADRTDTVGVRLGSVVAPRERPGVGEDACAISGPELSSGMARKSPRPGPPADQPGSTSPSRFRAERCIMSRTRGGRSVRRRKEWDRRGQQLVSVVSARAATSDCRPIVEGVEL